MTYMCPYLLYLLYHGGRQKIILPFALNTKPSLELKLAMRQTSPKYSEPLELRPLSPMNLPGISVEEPEPFQAQKAAALDDAKESWSTFAYTPMLDSLKKGQSDQYAPLRTSLLQRKSRRFATLWVTAALAVFASIFSIWYSYRVMVNEKALPSSLQLQPGTTVLVVNILSHVVAYLCWSLFSDTTEALRWALACRPEGVLLTSFLVLSRATPFIGVAYLCTTIGPHQIWAVQR
jgi:hypothetical protein